MGNTLLSAALCSAEALFTKERLIRIFIIDVFYRDKADMPMRCGCLSACGMCTFLKWRL